MEDSLACCLSADTPTVGVLCKITSPRHRKATGGIHWARNPRALQGGEEQVAPVTAITALRERSPQVIETGWLQIARIDRLGRISFLFSAEEYIRKLDVAGSSPVSRSIVSMGCKDPSD
jgi:hypothetical protein